MEQAKTTAAQIVVPRKLNIPEFINVDEIARGLSPFNPDGAAVAAGRLMLKRMRALADGQQSFAIETTCSGKGHLKFLQLCRERGWRITLVFLWLSSPELAVARVERRVSAGGHGVLRDVIVRRYWAGLRNMHAFYLPLADVAAIYDNSGGEPKLVTERIPNGELIVYDAARWLQLEKTSP